MPTDLLAAIERRAAEQKRANVAVLLVPVLMCIITVIAALENPALAAGFRQLGVF
jgi:hypothetical protein